MIGRLLGKIISTPLRIANVPMKVISKTGDFMMGETNTRSVRSRDPIGIDEVADAIDDAAQKADQ